MNPARSLGPALASGTWTDFGVYLVGPFAGAALRAFAYELIRGERPAVPPPATPEESHANRPVRLPA
jgi:crotonobetainyl-CoA:carnitine CoA-transferase CaiB-like acyl-CoA transferase